MTLPATALTALALAADLPPDHPPLGGTAERPAADALPTGHPPVPHEMDPQVLLRQIDAQGSVIRDRPKTFEIAVALGNLYYENARYAEAVEYFGQALAKAEDAFRAADELRAAKGRVDGATCPTPSPDSLERRLERVREARAAKRLDEALACAHAARRPAVEVLARRGTALFLLGRAAEAVEEHEKALSSEPDFGESLYVLGAILFDAYADEVAKLRRAQAAWRRFLKAAPGDRRAASVRRRLEQVDEAVRLGGIARARPLPPELQPRTEVPAPAAAVAPISPEMAEAIAGTPRTPELALGLANNVEEGEAHLCASRYPEALQAFRNVLPFEPNNPRARAGMAAALIGLGRPTADRVFMAAVELDPGSVDALAEKLRAQGNPKDARGLWERLIARAPAYAAKANLAAKLR